MILSPLFVLVEILVYPQDKIERGAHRVFSANHNLIAKLAKTERM